jgi:threonine dehydrogenase-like Zn-dependent dehydrogenase
VPYAPAHHRLCIAHAQLIEWPVYEIRQDLFVGNVADRDSPLAIHLVAQGLVDLKPLLTHTFKFGDALEAFEITKAGKDRDGKFVIKCVIDGPEDDFKI